LGLKKNTSYSFFGKWLAAFVVGLLLLFYGSGAWQALGILIVAPIAITILLMAWGWIVVMVVRRLGGDPSQGSVGILVFVSFACVLLPLVLAFLRHRH
jgi:hypothetical protein